MKPRHDSNEFFYVDENGVKRDAELHDAIINPVDFPIDEKIMKPIRERRRAERLAEQKKLQAEAKVKRRQSQWQREKARALGLLQKYEGQPRDQGRFSFGKEGGDDEGGRSTSPHAKDPKSASSLYRVDPNTTVESLIAEVPDAEELIDEAEQKVAVTKPTTSREGGYKTPTGSWTRERIREHLEMYDKVFTPEVVAGATPKSGEQPVLYVLGGRGGSGKGWITENEKGPLKAVMDKKAAVYLNSDSVKEAFSNWMGWNAGPVHPESGEVVKFLETESRLRGLSTILDITMQDKASTEERIKLFKGAGYRIEGYYMYAGPEKATKQAIGRFVRGTKEARAKGETDKMGRFVPPIVPFNSSTNEHNFDRHKRDFEYWEIYDNGGPTFDPKLHAKGGKK